MPEYCESCDADELWETQGIPAVWASPTHTCGAAGALALIDKTLGGLDEEIRSSWSADEVDDMLREIRARLASGTVEIESQS